MKPRVFLRLCVIDVSGGPWASSSGNFSRLLLPLSGARGGRLVSDELFKSAFIFQPDF